MAMALRGCSGRRRDPLVRFAYLRQHALVVVQGWKWFWDDVGTVPYGVGCTAFVGVGADAHISPGILNTKCHAVRHHFTVIQR